MSQLILGYWKIRGLVETIRILLHYLNIDYKEDLYEFGPAPDYNLDNWYNVKFKMGFDYPNVPYLIDGVEFLKRPEVLDRQETKGTDIYETFVNMVDADVYVLAHATSPFVSASHIGECVKNVQLGNYDSAFCAKKIQNFLWKDNRPLNFVLNDPPRTQDMSPIYMELSTAYVFTKDCFLKYNSRSGINPYICECTEIEAIDIDYPEDFELADVVYTHILNKNRK